VITGHQSLQATIRAMSAELSDLNDDHPLVLELSSLRQTAARFQVLSAHPYLVSASRIITDHPCLLA